MCCHCKYVKLTLQNLAEPTMTNEKARQQFFLTLFPSMAVFLAISLFIAFAAEPLGLPGTVVTGLAVVAGLLLVNAVWAHWRFINRIDEFLRSIQIKAVLAGLSLILAIASVWGYLEQYLDAPALPIFYLNPIYWLAYGVAAGILTIQAGGEI
jgi:hypothetical protein